MRLSLLYPETRSLDVVRSLAVDTEELGFCGMWLGSAFGFDPIMAVALAGEATSTIELGVAVVPTWPRHPVVMAQQALTASAACHGRFRLGIGPSHAPVMKMYGIELDRPIGHLREYLTVVRALLAEGQVGHKGEHYRVRAFLDVADAPPPPVLLGVLREQSARLAGSHADGALCWLGPADYLHRVVAPNMAAGAQAAGRPTPPLVAEFPCALSRDRDAVRAMAARDLAIYPQVPFYRAMWEAAGIPIGESGWTDEMLDASVVHGDEDAVAAAVRALFDAGADEVALSPFGVGDDPVASQQACVRVLSDIAKGG
jgi:F420-dependent oxidoreductase-like protein